MSDLVFLASTKAQISSYLRSPSHALLLLGPTGIGKGSASKWIATELLHLPDERSLEKYSYKYLIEPQGQSITIDSIRALQPFLKLKVISSKNAINRIAIIEQANLMTVEAQNALLKILEEPPENTTIILTSLNSSNLIPTIRSRCQTIHIKSPIESDMLIYFEKHGFDADTVKRAYLMSGGLPGFMTALLNQRSDHPLIVASVKAREILKADMFGRLKQVDEILKERSELPNILFMMGQMAHVALQQNAIGDHSKKSISQWHRVLGAVYKSEKALRVNAQQKLVLTNLMLELK